MKWTADRVGVDGVESAAISRAFGREAAPERSSSRRPDTPKWRLQECQRSLTEGVFVLCELEELVMLLKQSADMTAFLRRKIEAAVIDRNPLVRPLREG